MYISLRLRFCLTFWEEANSIVCDRVALAISIVFLKWEREADLFLKILAYKNTQNTSQSFMSKSPRKGGSNLRV